MPVEARTIDLSVAADLTAALRDADVVLNTAGPFFRFGPVVLDAAIATNTHYLDICDDPVPTMHMLGRDTAARAAGVCAVVGVGASPGVSNLLAARAAKELDVVTDCWTAWPVDAGQGPTGEPHDLPPDATDDKKLTCSDGRPTAAVTHWLEQCSGRIPVIERGVLVERPPLQPVALDVPGGGHGTAYTVGHPEPLTLASNLGVTGRAACLMVIRPATLAYLDGLRRDIDAGALDLDAAARQLVHQSLARSVRAAVGALGRRGPGSLPGFFAMAVGHLNGVPTRVMATLTGVPPGMAAFTGIPLALGLGQLLGDRRSTAPGVFAPEAALDPAAFFAALTPHCRPQPAAPNDLVTVRRCTSAAGMEDPTAATP